MRQWVICVNRLTGKTKSQEFRFGVFVRLSICNLPNLLSSMTHPRVTLLQAFTFSASMWVFSHFDIASFSTANTSGSPICHIVGFRLSIAPPVAIMACKCVVIGRMREYARILAHALYLVLGTLNLFRVLNTKGRTICSEGFSKRFLQNIIDK